MQLQAVVAGDISVDGTAAISPRLLAVVAGDISVDGDVPEPLIFVPLRKQTSATIDNDRTDDFDIDNDRREEFDTQGVGET
jgi:hypothetical protein